MGYLINYIFETDISKTYIFSDNCLETLRVYLSQMRL